MVSFQTTAGILLAMATWTNLCVGQDPQLIASSAFFMTLRPVSRELNYASLRALEQAAAREIDEKDTDDAFVAMDVAVQDVAYIKSNSTADTDPAMKVRFFALGIVPFQASNDVDSTSELQIVLNKLVGRSFNDGVEGTFLRLLRTDRILGEATSVMVEPMAPVDKDSPNENPDDISSSSPSKLSLLDIALITVSGLILIGICYMVVEHVKDQGYIENERLRVLNQPQNSSDPDEAMIAAEAGTKTTTILQDEPALKVIRKIDSQEDEMDDDTPSTPSTTDSIGEDPRPCTPDRSVRIKTTTISATDPDVLMVKPDQPTFLSEFDNTGKWFHPKNTKPRRLHKHPRHPVSIIAEGDEDEESSGEVYEDGSSDEETEDIVDPFHVDVSAVLSTEDDVDTAKSVASAASSVTEWMKTIRVVTTNIEHNISEDLTQSLPDEEKEGSASVDSSSALSTSSNESSSSSSNSSSSSSSDSSEESVDSCSLVSDAHSKLEEKDLESNSLEKSLASSRAEERARKIVSV